MELIREFSFYRLFFDVIIILSCCTDKMITIEQIRALREKTGVSVMQCRKALEETGGDAHKALILLQKRGADAASKKSDRKLGSVRIAAYVHSTGSVGAMIELASETDFVSKNTDFYNLAYDIAMHVVAANPSYLRIEDVPQSEKDRVAEVFAKEAADKPVAIREKILAGKLDSFFKERTLLSQPFVKNQDMTIQNLIESAIQKFGEKIEILRFVRFP